MMNQSQQLLTLKELSHELKVKESWVRFQVFHGRIPFIKVGRLIRFDKEAIKKWIQNNNKNFTK